jgi:hypothetical protein
MNRLALQLAVTSLVAFSISIGARAASPVERELQSSRTVQAYQRAGQPPRRPIGTIDFSASGSSARHAGPWDLETDALRGAGGVIFYEDGSATMRSRERQYHRSSGSRCTTLGNVTVCR